MLRLCFLLSCILSTSFLPDKTNTMRDDVVGNALVTWLPVTLAVLTRMSARARVTPTCWDARARVTPTCSGARTRVTPTCWCSLSPSLGAVPPNALDVACTSTVYALSCLAVRLRAFRVSTVREYKLLFYHIDQARWLKCKSSAISVACFHNHQSNQNICVTWFQVSVIYLKVRRMWWFTSRNLQCVPMLWRHWSFTHG